MSKRRRGSGFDKEQHKRYADPTDVFRIAFPLYASDNRSVIINDGYYFYFISYYCCVCFNTLRNNWAPSQNRPDWRGADSDDLVSFRLAVKKTIRVFFTFICLMAVIISLLYEQNELIIISKQLSYSAAFPNLRSGPKIII